MQSEFISMLFYESIKVILMISSPILLSVLFTGLIVSLLQTIIQINEQTLSFIPKVISLFFVLIFFGHWMLNVIINYMQYIFSNISLSVFYLC